MTEIFIVLVALSAPFLTIALLFYLTRDPKIGTRAYDKWLLKNEKDSLKYWIKETEKCEKKAAYFKTEANNEDHHPDTRAELNRLYLKNDAEAKNYRKFTAESRQRVESLKRLRDSWRRK